MPLNKAGALRLPAISEPKPSGEHLKDIRAPSPPVEPPAVLNLLNGFNVFPVMLLWDSKLIIF